jgi:hypothetical protein
MRVLVGWASPTGHDDGSVGVAHPRDPVFPRLAVIVEGFVLQHGSNNGGADEPAESFESVTIPLDP